MAWVVFYVGIGVLGVAVLGAVGFRLYRQVRAFARDVKAAGERITALSDQLARESAARTPRP
ncbi:MAG TPA: hypothetical protein VHB69_04675 [Mycobacteriales bacterium]|nr:hypothetical protein [Mycobacteriales bacterium]